MTIRFINRPTNIEKEEMQEKIDALDKYMKMKSKNKWTIALLSIIPFFLGCGYILCNIRSLLHACILSVIFTLSMPIIYAILTHFYEKWIASKMIKDETITKNVDNFDVYESILKTERCIENMTPYLNPLNYELLRVDYSLDEDTKQWMTLYCDFGELKTEELLFGICELPVRKCKYSKTEPDYIYDVKNQMIIIPV